MNVYSRIPLCTSYEEASQIGYSVIAGRNEEIGFATISARIVQFKSNQTAMVPKPSVVDLTQVKPTAFAPFDAFTNLTSIIASINTFLDVDETTMVEAEAAVERLMSRKSENICTWAETLANDLSKLDD